MCVCVCVSMLAITVHTVCRRVRGGNFVCRSVLTQKVHKSTRPVDQYTHSQLNIYCKFIKFCGINVCIFAVSSGLVNYLGT